jgi:hypothetical protein
VEQGGLLKENKRTKRNGFNWCMVKGIEKPLHIVMAEKALNKTLPLGSIVHHAEGGQTGPLVICQDKPYHNLLHARMRAYAATGDPKKRKCKRCKKYDDLSNLRIDDSSFVHTECAYQYLQEWHKKNPDKAREYEARRVR